MTIHQPTAHEENKLDELVTSLYTRIQNETANLLKEQIAQLKLDYEEVQGSIVKQDYPQDAFRLADYFYDGVFILGVRISRNRLAIEFTVPKVGMEKEPSHPYLNAIEQKMIDGGVDPSKIERKTYGNYEHF